MNLEDLKRILPSITTDKKYLYRKQTFTNKKLTDEQLLLKKAFILLECLKLTRLLKELESFIEDEDGFEEDDVEEYFDDSDDEEYFIEKILGKQFYLYKIDYTSHVVVLQLQSVNWLFFSGSNITMSMINCFALLSYPI